MIKVYLDTQDFAHLYRDDLSADLAGVKKSLLSMKDGGQVKFPLSFLTLFEFVRDYETEFETDRQKRSEFLSQLCGTDTLPFFLDLARRNQPIDWNTWLPLGSLDKFSIANMFSVLRHEIKRNSQIPRKLRNALQTPPFLRSFLKDFLLRQSLQAASNTNRHFELSGLSFDFFRDYLLDKISEEDANKIFRDSVFEPAKFFSIWYQRFSHKNALNQFYGEPIIKFHEMSIAFHNKLPEMFVQLKNSRARLKIHNTKLEKSNRELLSLGIDLGHTRLQLPALPDWQEFYEQSNLIKTFAVFDEPIQNTLKSYFGALFDRQFVPKKSDIIDIFHSVYLDHVDLWRTDRNFADFLIRSNSPAVGKIVPSLRELPNRIEELLSYQHSWPG